MDDQRPEPDEDEHPEPVRCLCEWALMDTGNQFYSRIVKPHPSCPAHPQRD